MAMENKMDEVKKLSLNEMENVSGGTFDECTEINMIVTAGIISGKYKNIKRSWAFSDSSVTEEYLDQLGFECHASAPFLGIGRVNNTYKDKETGQNILHSEVMHFLRNGEKKWLE
jgi:hypothetical protein